MGGKRSIYYFKVHSCPNDSVENDEDKILMTRYFTSGYDVAEYLGVSRPSIFNALKNGGKLKRKTGYIIERCEPPIPYYEITKTKNPDMIFN